MFKNIRFGKYMHTVVGGGNAAEGGRDDAAKRKP